MLKHEIAEKLGSRIELIVAEGEKNGDLRASFVIRTAELIKEREFFSVMRKHYRARGFKIKNERNRFSLVKNGEIVATVDCVHGKKFGEPTSVFIVVKPSRQEAS